MDPLGELIRSLSPLTAMGGATSKWRERRGEGAVA